MPCLEAHKMVVEGQIMPALWCEFRVMQCADRAGAAGHDQAAPVSCHAAGINGLHWRARAP